MSATEREGGDITAADMVNPYTEPSNIQRYFAGSTVFVTGATGFVGRLLVEKLLRSCHELEKIYILVRPKRGKTCKQRFQEYFNDPLYERLKRERPEAMQKLTVMEGDCALPDLGLSDKDKQIIVSEVKTIFHVAATVRFDEKLRTAVYINVRGTRDLLRLAKKVKDLKGIVCVSTAFAFCPRRKIDEVFYEPTITGDKLLTLVETLSDDKLEAIVPTVLDEWPNTYVLTKSVAEDVIKKEGFGLPLAVVRPSIVIATSKEPVSGWIDNFYGATGMFVGATLGLIRTMHCELDNLAEMVPADYVVNCIIAAAWDIATTKGSHLNLELFEPTDEQSEPDIPIYNYVSAPQRPITWSECISKGNRHIDSIASPLQVWHFMFWAHSNKLIYLFLHYMLHMLPAYIVDFLASCIGKKPQLVKGYRKIEKFLNVIAYFSTRQWFFRNDNTQKLWDKLNYEDKKMFEFSMSFLDWDLYFYTFPRGARVYLLKDPMDTIPKGQTKRFKLKIAHYVLVGILLLSIVKLLIMLCTFVIKVF